MTSRRLAVLYGRVPRLAALFAFAAMASLGLPGLAGFWGEMLAIRSAVYPGRALPVPTYVVLAVIAALGVILTSAYFLAADARHAPGPPAAVRPVNADVARSSSRPPRSTRGPRLPAPCGPTYGLEWLAWSPLVVLTLVLGVAPGCCSARSATRRARSSGGSDDA